ncbi:MAG: hypothetical protein RMJ88_16585 [Thermogemmata sp.]|nr:hypothetical protein [Thermogemmata sp.]
MTQDLTPDEHLLLSKVPLDGSSIGNKTLREILGWDEQKYWSVRDSLVDREILRLGRGKGGSVARVLPAYPITDTAVPETTCETGESSKAEEPSKAILREDSLYNPLAEVLRDKWSKELRLDQVIVQVTARQGRRETGGTWTRPDIVVVNVANYLNLPGKYVDVITFEVKTAKELDVTAVYEALSHLRAATRAYLIVSMSPEEKEKMRTLLDIVTDEASRYGIGFIITPEDVTNYDEWDFLLDATPVQGVPSRIDDFLERQLSEDNKRALRRYIK